MSLIIAAAAFVLSVIALRIAYRTNRMVSKCQSQLLLEQTLQQKLEPEQPEHYTEENPPPAGPGVEGDLLWDESAAWVATARKAAGWR